MDLASGRVVELRVDRFRRECGSRLVPRRDPDRLLPVRREGRRRSRPTEAGRDLAGRCRRQGLRQLSPTTLAAAYPEWSPDGARILFESIDGEQQDIYTIRPDGTDVRRLTTDGVSASATWTPDGRILFVRPGGAAAGLVDDGRRWHRCRPPRRGRRGRSGGRRLLDRRRSDVAAGRWRGLVPPPWKAATGVAVGPPAPTPVPTPVPELAPGFAWTGSMTTDEGGPLGEIGDPARRWARALRGRLRHGCRAVRPGDRHVHADRRHDRRPRGVGRDAAARWPRPVHRRIQLWAGRPGRHLGIGRAVRPGDRDLQPDRLDGHAARVPDRDTVGGRSRPDRRRRTRPQARARARGSPSPRIDSSSPRPACSRPPRCTTRRPARSAGRGR